MTFTFRGAAALAIAISCCAVLPAQDKVRKIPADQEVVKHPSGISYSILKKGSGEKSPAPGDAAMIHFTEWLDDGTLIGTSRDQAPVQITVGDPRVPFALGLAPQLLSKGGQLKMTVPPERAYGKNGVPGKVPPHSTMVYEVELVDHAYRPKPAEFVQGDPAKTQATRTGVQYQILEPGSGGKPGPNDIVEIEYTIWDVTGKLIFGSFNTGKTDRAPVKMMSHPFLQEVLPMMQVGAAWRIVVPADQTMKELTGDTVWHLKLIDREVSPGMPKATVENTTSTASGLQYERLVAGSGDRPRDRFVCELEWAFWKSDGTFVAGSTIGGNMPVMIGRAQHKFLDEILRLMQVGEVIRVEVPQKLTAPQLLVFDSVWRIKLVGMREPLPLPEFQLPKSTELTTTKSGLQYKVIARGEGQGPLPRRGSVVTVHYAGWFTSGQRFDSSYEKGVPVVFDIDGRRRTIDGLNEGLQLMKAGDTFLFVIPAKLGFGARGTSDGTIPPDATLVYQVRLLSIGS